MIRGSEQTQRTRQLHLGYSSGREPIRFHNYSHYSDLCYDEADARDGSARVIPELRA